MIEIKKIDESPDCDCEKVCKGIEVPSRDEIEALNAMREIKVRVRRIKRKISDLHDKTKNQAEKSIMEKELFRLKEKWEGWDLKRKEAARIRMILLGHEEP